jgi:hypothetical protein
VVSAVRYGGFRRVQGVLGFAVCFLYLLEKHWRQALVFLISFSSVRLEMDSLMGGVDLSPDF